MVTGSPEKKPRLDNADLLGGYAVILRFLQHECCMFASPSKTLGEIKDQRTCATEADFCKELLRCLGGTCSTLEIPSCFPPDFPGNPAWYKPWLIQKYGSDDLHGTIVYMPKLSTWRKDRIVCTDSTPTWTAVLFPSITTDPAGGDPCSAIGAPYYVPTPAPTPTPT